MDKFKGKILPFLIKVVKLIVGEYPIGVLVIGIIDSLVTGVKDTDGISNKSVKNILIAVAKSKRNNIDQVKMVKALKVLGLDSVSKEEMEGIPEVIKK